MNIKFLAVFSLFLLAPFLLPAQDNDEKIKHADPVFDDLTTELGARKGENELNVNFGFSKLRGRHHELISQLEYEAAVIDNLGIELVIPYTTYFNNPESQDEQPLDRPEYFQWAAQYTFYQNTARKISLALSFRNSFERARTTVDHTSFSMANIHYLPFLIAAKNWQDRYFLLLGGGPGLNHNLQDRALEFEHQMTSAFHYTIFDQHMVGIELNKFLVEEEFEMFIRPQLILGLGESFILGISSGIPVSMPEVGWTHFLRLAYEFR